MKRNFLRPPSSGFWPLVSGLCLLASVLWLPSSASAQALTGPTSATTNAIPTYQDNKHVKDNPGFTYSAGTLTVTNANMTSQIVSNIGASKLAGTDAAGHSTNIVVGTGLSLSGGTLSATGTTSSPTNTPIVLTLGGTGGTNVSGGDWSLGSASGTTFKLILTTNAYFGPTSFSNVPTTNGQQNALLYVYHDSSSTPYTNTWTNSVFAFVNGVSSIQTTNAGSVDVYSLFNDLATNGQINVVPMNNLHR